MSKTAIILVAVIVLAVMNDAAFRHQERLEAHKAMVDSPTPATREAFQHEMELEQYHRTHEQFIRGVMYFGALAVFELPVFIFGFDMVSTHRPNTALEATPHSHCDFASEPSDYFELRIRGASAFVR